MSNNEHIKERDILRLKRHPNKREVNIYNLMPGLDLLYNRFNVNEHIEMDYCKSKKNILEFNYCEEGRFGCTINNNKRVYLGEGEMEINIATIERINPEFPLGYYKGISIIIDIDAFEKQIKNTFISEISNKAKLLYNFLLNNDLAVLLKNDSRMVNLFRDIYEGKNENNISYLKLKVLEIILLLEPISYERNKDIQYFSSDVINKIKCAHNEVILNLENKMTLTDLSKKYGVSLTNFKKCFKEIYGNPYYTYLKKYKIHKAIHYLEETNLSISEIALKVGYDNPSKFISAFKELVGYTPREYKKKNVRLEHLNLFGVEIKNLK